MSNTWFRFYHEVVDDPKVQRLSDRMFKSWVNFMCIAAKHDGALPDMEDVAYRLHVTKLKAEFLLNELVKANLFEWEGGIARPHNWNGRQFQSDGSTKRVQKFRTKRQPDVPETDERNVSETVDETFHETKAETDQNRTDTEQSRTDPPKVPLPGDECLPRYTPEFEVFWGEYPRKTGKEAAFKAWQKRRFSQRTQERLLAALTIVKQSRDWVRDNGQFIPHPSTWLNQGRWDDEVPAALAAAARTVCS